MVYTQEEFAKIKNRADQSHLLSKLQRIEREKKDEIRMLNTEMQRFKYKCSRFNVRSALSLPTKKVICYYSYNFCDFPIVELYVFAF